MASIALLLACTSSFAKDWQVQMLNYGNEGSMTFEPSFIQAQIGDSVTFVPTHSGHNAQSYVVPKGDQQWKSPIDKAYTVLLNNEGVHFYYCPPHLMMGMIGMIQVGNALNMETLNKKSKRLRSKVALKPERVDALLQQVTLP
ncbi:pseudoazurin [Marinomonas sp. C1424]|uniref:Pseudoazurin n=2 Tax=Marinomonas transparens TaxID=2795388 RepID=A0A934JY51_9GAMM|nr:pseudoazurin [Marinomonas transparens]